VVILLFQIAGPGSGRPSRGIALHIRLRLAFLNDSFAALLQLRRHFPAGFTSL
jgi:hypothetical protein